MVIQRFHCINAFDDAKNEKILKQLQQINHKITGVSTEKCYHVEHESTSLSSKAEVILRWLLKNVQDSDNLTLNSQLELLKTSNSIIIEIGPRFNFSTPFSTNCVNICHNIGLNDVKRLEVSIKYLIEYQQSKTGTFDNDVIENIIDLLSDRMTECRYTDENLPKFSFDERLSTKSNSALWNTIPIMKLGRKALEDANQQLGLAFGEWDIEFYTNLFKNVLKRDPTSVELFDCAQSNSEHSRHWFFRGNMIIDGNRKPKSLIQMIIDTQKTSNQNNTIKFSDNSSAIKGFRHETICPSNVTGPGQMLIKTTESDLIFTAETHNMPTAVAPFSGATTGTGGRIRDVQGVGRGGLCIAGTAGYCVGNLNIPGYRLPYNEDDFKYPPSFASPLKIIIEASNGASDYGNKFGEPVISGFAISYGIKNSLGERDEYVKPIMFSGGLGIMDSTMRKKIDPKKGMLLAKIGGPVYRIGVGGGAASSVEVQGDNSSELDFNAVQRGDAEMENKLNRVVRACIEMKDDNPILAIHDQGAGGNGNVLKELVEPGFAGAVIFSKEFQLGDPTISILELWGAEYQENNAILCKQESREILQKICDRERCPINFVGVVSGNGYVTLIESELKTNLVEKYVDRKNRDTWEESVPFDLELKHVLGDMPKREYNLTKSMQHSDPLTFFKKITYDVEDALELVLSLMTVGSKRFLTNKVDRCVTGLIAQQQCVGPLHTPLSDYAITTCSHYTKHGIATSIGTQPIKGLLSPKAGARMSVAEAISNLVFAGITELADVKCSGNWMWAAKLHGEGAKMYEACEEMCKIMEDLNIAVDGGKDSLSMAARIDTKQTVKSPGTLVISTYAPCPDVNIKVTPDLKSPSRGNTGELIWINIENQFRIGGSALAQAFGQQGMKCPNLEKSQTLKSAFNVTQKLLKNGKLLAGHDISDGGLIVCLLEMAFGGLSGLKIDLMNVNQFVDLMNKNQFVDFKDLNHDEQINLMILFAEECGWVLEVDKSNLTECMTEFQNNNVPVYHLGQSIGYGLDSTIEISNNGNLVLKNNCRALFKQWEATSFELEKLQTNIDCAIEEYNSLDYRTGPKYSLTFNPDVDLFVNRALTKTVRVAVLREEGVNSDREMIASLINANFEVHDVSMYDLLEKKTTLDQYRGIIFPGGFSYADTLGSAKGWAANIMYSDLLAPQFDHFKNRTNTFSLGICNGCQLMSLIGWIGNVSDNDDNNNKRIIDIPNVALFKNQSERFECRWSTVRINKSKSIMLREMDGSVLGCWIAHGEGKFSFKTDRILKQIRNNDCIAMQYVDDMGSPTEFYPMNPNGSTNGIAGLCSNNGRHLALMPHPERCSLMYQWPYLSPGFNPKKSPWQRMFDNAYIWCTKN